MMINNHNHKGSSNASDVSTGNVSDRDEAPHDNNNGIGNENLDHTSSHFLMDQINERNAGTEQAEAIAKRETNIVCGMRLVVLLVLLASAFLLAFFVYHYLKSDEQNEFQEDFFADANKVLHSIGTSLDLTLGAVDALAVSMVSYAKNTNQTWPVS